MNNLGISTDPALLSVNLPTSLTESPSVSTFLPEEEASMRPLLPNTPSPPPLAFSHPLTPSADNDSNDSVNCEDTKAETSSSGSSSGLAMDVVDVAEAAAATLFHKHAYHHLGKNGDITSQETGLKQNGYLNIPITKDTPSFVSWNWPMIRKCTFFVFMSSLLAMCAVVVAMIIMLPKTCNPKTSWYKGSIFYEIFPASFQDSGNDGLGDLRGIAQRVDYLQTMRVGAVRLNSIFPSEHYPDHFQNISSLMAIDKVLGTETDFSRMMNALHIKNISLILDLPIYPYLNQLGEAAEIENTSLTNSTTTLKPTMVGSNNAITEAMRFWLARGVDGFYVKGLEHFASDSNLEENIAEWKYILGADRVLIVSKKLIDSVDEESAKQILQHIDLVDVYIDIANGTKSIKEQISNVLNGSLAVERDAPWIQWSLGGVDEQRISRSVSPNATLAATLMQLMLPGTPSIFYGDEIALESSHDPYKEYEESKHLHHLSPMIWNGSQQFTDRKTLPWQRHGIPPALNHFAIISEMIALRDRSPSIYQNAIFKENKINSNTNVRQYPEDVVIIERWYPRRNSFVSITNLGKNSATMDLTSMFYSGVVMLGEEEDEKVYFKEFEIGPLQTIIVKLDK